MDIFYGNLQQSPPDLLSKIQLILGVLLRDLSMIIATRHFTEATENISSWNYNFSIAILNNWGRSIPSIKQIPVDSCNFQSFELASLACRPLPVCCVRFFSTRKLSFKRMKIICHSSIKGVWRIEITMYIILMALIRGGEGDRTNCSLTCLRCSLFI